MKRIALLSALVACSEPAPEPLDLNAVADTVRALLTAQAKDWNAGDLEAFVRVYADDAVFLSPNGVEQGREKIFDRYVKRYRSGDKEMGQLTLDPFDVRVSPDGEEASVAMKWKLTWSEKPTASGLSLVTLHQRDGQWLILQDASM